MSAGDGGTIGEGCLAGGETLDGIVAFLSDSDRQIAELPLAFDDRGKFVALGVAFVVATFRDELRCGGEFFLRGLLKAIGVFGGRGGRRRERGETKEFGEGEAAEFEMHVAKMQPHRPRLGDLQHLVEVAPRGGEVADGAEQAGAGEKAFGEFIRHVRAAQFGDGGIEMFASFDEMRRGVGGRRRGTRHAERGAAEADIVESCIKYLLTD